MRHGITGMVRLDGSACDPDDAARVSAMSDVIAHRWGARPRVRVSGGVALALAHAEDDAAARPGEREGDRTIVVALDGDVSNVAALARELAGDGVAADASVERVVAALYRRDGIGFAARLEGAFAIALWDGGRGQPGFAGPSVGGARGRLVLVRDRVGVRPLFTARAGAGRLVFGSEAKALLAHPACPREVDWLGTLARFALPLKSYPPQSAFVGITPVAPGTVEVWEAASGERRVERYWALRFVSDEQAEGDRRSDDDIIAGYREVLARAVGDALGGAARGSGRAALFLSGGIDSIAIAALGREAAPVTFTVLNLSTWGNGDAAVARAAAAHLGLDNHQVVMRRGASALTPEHWKKIVWVAESARCRGQDYLKSQLAAWAHARAPELMVQLHGEGSDELIGADTRNYADYTGDESYAHYLDELKKKQREELLDFDALAAESWFGGRTMFRDEALAKASGRAAPRHPMQRRAHYCLEGLAEIVLQREDRFAALNGMEARAPFVDHRVLDFVAQIPPRAYPTLYWRKHVLRHGLRDVLPDALRLQRKVGFYAGADGRFTSRMLVDLVTADGGALVREAFGDAERHAVLAPGLVADLVAATVRDPDAAAIDGLLTLVNLGLLEGMAKDVAAQARLARLEGPALEALTTWDEAALPALFADTRHTIDGARTLRLGPGVELARPEHAAADGDAATLWIVVDDQVRYVIDEPEAARWSRVLRALDAQRAREEAHTLEATLGACGTTLAEVRKYLEEALEFEVVAFV